MKQIILTGSSSGFGLTAVKTLALKGHTVYATMRNVNGVNAAVAKELTDWAKTQQAKVVVVELDVASTTSVNNAIAEIVQQSGGRIDVLINNAGISFMGLGESLSIEQTEMLYQVNTIGPERTMKAVLPYMHKQKEGLIINVTSVQSRQYIPILSTYNGTKAALDAVTMGYHFELKSSGIDVVSIQPGAYQSTDIVTKGIAAKNAGVSGQYGKDVLDFQRALFRFFEPTPESPDPKEVADVMLKLVELPKGQRPVTSVVGGGANTGKIEEMNETMRQIVEGMFGFLPTVFPA
ncbi:SDR family NAD(P)-dependent oxidoreductase [Chitinophaga pinensis]|uniref:SDR family NAD(P)-dependent oxidoreductase n=1 Tax=Chitinophaga pinensis TaxID=79329 RepID=A0A5C6LR42_9BACT|nr:SDR family NAD(P)-dependent oxidoreductase [Chitinophaga pinensis]TWV99351.1 SDR family NAD(P)-dependent oxidoreductase [Chitinophaga pinensis]